MFCEVIFFAVIDALLKLMLTLVLDDLLQIHYTCDDKLTNFSISQHNSKHLSYIHQAICVLCLVLWVLFNMCFSVIYTANRAT